MKSQYTKRKGTRQFLLAVRNGLNKQVGKSARHTQIPVKVAAKFPHKIKPGIETQINFFPFQCVRVILRSQIQFSFRTDILVSFFGLSTVDISIKHFDNNTTL